MSDHTEFGKFLFEHRRNARLTMREVSEKVDISTSYLSDIEKGRRGAPDHKLESLAAALSLTAEDKERMYDLAALTRDDQAPADLSNYLRETENARVALRRARNKNFTDHDWQRIIDIIENSEK